jgi:Rho-binding antiterminator
MHRYPIKLTMSSGEVVEGVAVNTEQNNAREECILFNNDSGQNLIVLDDIAKLEVCVENPHFEVISFESN